MSVASAGAGGFMLVRPAPPAELRALRAALHKIQLAATLVDSIPVHDVSREEAERLASAKAEIRSVSRLIKIRLQE